MAHRAVPAATAGGNNIWCRLVSGVTARCYNYVRSMSGVTMVGVTVVGPVMMMISTCHITGHIIAI